MHIRTRGHVALCLLAGCTTITRQGVFATAKSIVQERTGQEIVWITDTVEEKLVEERINTILTTNLSLVDCIKISLLRNPKLQSKYEEIGIAQADLLQSGLLRNPTLDLSRRFPGRAAEFDVIQDFLQLLLLPLKTKLFEKELEIARLDVTQSVLAEIAETKEAYYRHQANLQLLGMRRQSVDVSEASYVATRELRRAGNARALDLQNEAAALARSRLDLAEAEVRAIESREKLNIRMGVWGKRTEWTILNRLPSPGTKIVLEDGLESLAVTKRQDLAAARQKIEALAIQFGLSAYLTVFPESQLSGHYEREPEGNRSIGPSLTIPLPIFDWGKAASLRGSAEIRRALRDYEALAIQIRSDVRSAFARMASARHRVDYSIKEALPVQRRILEETQLLYNGMFVGAATLLQAKQAQINSGVEYIATLLEYWTARTELENAVGGYLPGAETPSVAGHADTDLTKHDTQTDKQHHHRQQAYETN